MFEISRVEDCFIPFQALAGEVGMSSELDDVARSLFNGQIPAIWRRLAPETLKSLGNWIIHFENRYKQYAGWVCVLTAKVTPEKVKKSELNAMRKGVYCR